MRVQQHQHVFVVRLCRKIGGIGRFDGAAETTPEIQLPTNIKARTVLPHTTALSWSRRLLAVHVQGVGAGLLQLRITTRQRDTKLGARFDHAQAGDSDAGIVGIGRFDQSLKNGIRKDLPPFAHARLLALLAGLRHGRAAPGFAPGLLLRLEVRSQSYAAGKKQRTDR
ncbi:protein of unknown function (plasmid) [Cupriavidus taiwanensis]|uniref:Uncharacterized protein n=1 Tax=Cupriavidus taiwanensis TaxID=164546 RepID=A0A375ISW2_9BURK|nr:protein of unknown function [Cupriavidus taiwanensis]